MTNKCDNYDYTKCNNLKGYIYSIKIKKILLILIFLLISITLIKAKLYGIFITIILVLLVWLYVENKLNKMTYLTSKPTPKTSILHKSIDLYFTS